MISSIGFDSIIQTLKKLDFLKRILLGFAGCNNSTSIGSEILQNLREFASSRKIMLDFVPK
jgi:hypothetical protein